MSGSKITITEPQKTLFPPTREYRNILKKGPVKEADQSERIFLESVLDNIPNMIFVKDAKELRFIRFNKAGEELLGYLKEELLGKNDYDFFPQSEADFFTMKDRSVLSDLTVLDIPEEVISTRYNGIRTLHTRKIPIYGLDGRAEYLLGISEDITEKKNLEESRLQMRVEQEARLKAEEALRARDEFISVASHELKTPLSVLHLQAQLYKRYSEKAMEHSTERIDQFMDLIDKQVAKMVRLVEDMLDISRMRTGKLTMEWESFNLNELIRDILERMSETFKTANCEAKFESNSDQVLGTWDKVRLEQVIVNLITNAIRYDGGHPIEIKLSTHDGSVQISVSDHGIGIAKENQEKIFDRFERAVELNSVNGLGLGLYIAKQLVRAHSGKIWVESELGRGSTFFVELPKVSCPKQNLLLQQQTPTPTENYSHQANPLHPPLHQ